MNEQQDAHIEGLRKVAQQVGAEFGVTNPDGDMHMEASIEFTESQLLEFINHIPAVKALQEEVEWLYEQLSNAYDNVTVHEAPAGMVMMPEDTQQEITQLREENEILRQQKAGGDTMVSVQWERITTLEATNAAQAEQLAAKQAQIDALMLEYCPDEMGKDQFDEWARNQKPAPPEIAAIIANHTAELYDQSSPAEPQATVELTDDPFKLKSMGVGADNDE